MNKKNCDFSGWATKNDLKCSDGRVIRSGAFSVQDGATVPLVWNHQHNSVDEVLGHAILENKEDGVYAYGFFNNNPKGQHAKECVQHGDVTNMSIWANNLKQKGSDVFHGVIREVSLVLAGANPGAFIESVMAHGEPMDDYDEEGIFYTDDDLVIAHAIDESKKETKEETKTETKETPKEETKTENKENSEETIQDVIDTMTEKQQNVMYALIGEMMSDDNSDDSDTETEKEDKEEAEMKHNIFSDGQENTNEYLSHSDVEKIFNDAKRIGSLREAVRQNFEEGGALAHKGIPDVPTGGMTEGKETDTVNYNDYGKYGFKGPEMFYPDHRAITNVPEFIGRDTSWVNVVMGGVHHTPFSRVKSMYANITEDEARAKGYFKKGEAKKYEVFKTLKRVINPTTIYKLQKLDRDDIIDITDFDVVSWIRGEMRVMLDEEVARAILIGDGRQDGTEDKISEECIRPISKDVDLFNVKVPIQFVSGATGADKAKQVIDSIIRAHKNYRGSGNPTMFTTEDWLTEMLLLEDKIGHKLYKTTQELATALRVSNIVTVEVMEAAEKKYGDGQDEELIAVIVNLNDYNVGQDRGGEINMFDDFDIDFNQYKYLIETRMSGGLVKPFSALTVSGKSLD